MIFITVILLILHILLYTFLKFLNNRKNNNSILYNLKNDIENNENKINQAFLFPHFEIKIFILFSMGMLDVGFGVLSSKKSSIGWKVLYMCLCAHVCHLSLSRLLYIDINKNVVYLYIYL